MGLETIGAIVIAIAVLVGAGAHYLSKKNDSPVEQVAEAVLRAKGIDIDFSASDKKSENEQAQESKE